MKKEKEKNSVERWFSIVKWITLILGTIFILNIFGVLIAKSETPSIIAKISFWGFLAGFAVQIWMIFKYGGNEEKENGEDT